MTGGLSFALNERLTCDVAYTHIFVQDAPIDISATSRNPFFNPALGSYVGVSSPHIDIFSLGLRYKLFEPAAAPLMTKG